MKKKKEKEIKVFKDCFESETDPDGMYTGTNLGNLDDAEPVQDADDL